ncbi:MAG: hypothetical protein JWO53_210, partial [Chlamydiia bacterium]|nr:hypothetical protein [Chlamydiia bacterium]
MRNILAKSLFTVLLLLALFWGFLCTNRGQEWAKLKLQTLASEMSGYQVKISHLRGAPPFIITLDHVEVFDRDKKLIHIQTIRAVPAWFDIALGRIAFLSLHIDGVTFPIKEESHSITTSAQASASELLHSFCLADYLPKRRLFIHSLSGSLEYQKEVLVANGSLFWYPKRSYLESFIQVTHANTSTMSVDLKAKKREIKACIEATTHSSKVAPFEKAYVKTTLSSRHPAVIERFLKAAKMGLSDVAPLVEVTLSSSLTPKDKETVSIQSHGSILKDKSATFTLTKVNYGLFSSTGLLSGTVTKDKNALQLHMTSDLFAFNALKFTDLHCVLSAMKQEGSWMGSLLCDSRLQQQIFHIDANWATDGKTKASLTNLNGIIHTTTLQGNLECLFTPLLVKGDIEGLSYDISPFTRFFKKSAQGSATFKAHFEPVMSIDVSTPGSYTQQMGLLFEFKNLRSTVFGSKKISIQAQGIGHLLKPQLTVRASCMDGEWKHLEFSKCEIDSKIDFAKELSSPIHLISAGKVDKGAFTIQCDAEVSPRALEVKTFTFSLDKTEATL